VGSRRGHGAAVVARQPSVGDAPPLDVDRSGDRADGDWVERRRLLLLGVSLPGVRLEFRTGAEIKGTIPTYDGGAFVGSWDGRFYRLDLEDGTEEWSFETGRVIMSNPGIDPDAGVVYFGSDDNRVYALDTDTGEELWSTNVRGNVIGSLSVTADAVLVGSYDAHLYALEKGTGEQRWRVGGVGHVTSEAVPHGDRILFAERGDISGYWDDKSETLHEPGRAYSLVPRK